MENYFQDETLLGNEKIKEAMFLYYENESDELYAAACLAVRERMKNGGHFLFPADIENNEDGTPLFLFNTLVVQGYCLIAAFTDREEFEKAPPTGVVSLPIVSMLENIMQQEVFAGIIINPWGDQLVLCKSDIAMILAPDSEDLT